MIQYRKKKVVLAWLTFCAKGEAFVEIQLFRCPASWLVVEQRSNQ